jgi:uncharacterized protein (DUF305 family)
LARIGQRSSDPDVAGRVEIWQRSRAKEAAEGVMKGQMEDAKQMKAWFKTWFGTSYSG